jgi:hypothetical protein
LASEYVPSLHSKVEPFGGLVDAVELDFEFDIVLFATVFAGLLVAIFDVELVIEFTFEFESVFVIVFTAMFVFVFTLLTFKLLALLELPPQAARARDAPRASVSKDPVFIIFLAAPRRTRVPAPRTLFGI